MGDMQRLRTGALEERDRNSGTYNFGPVVIPVGAERIRYSVPRVSWAQKSGRTRKERDVIEARFQLSLDGGSTWTDWGRFTAAGGDSIDIDGSISPASSLDVGLVEPRNPQRVLRGNIECFVRLYTSCDIDVSFSR